MNSLLANLEHDLGIPPDKSRSRTMTYNPETLRGIEKAPTHETNTIETNFTPALSSTKDFTQEQPFRQQNNKSIGTR